MKTEQTFTTILEYTDKIQCNDGNIFTNTLVLLSDDFGVVIVMRLEILVYTNWELSLYLGEDI